MNGNKNEKLVINFAGLFSYSWYNLSIKKGDLSISHAARFKSGGFDYKDSEDVAL
ncbi:hypothetical protein HMPREF0492_0600 [Lactobacillus acidophilus ATCC 4796]|nr:hypothetical protein HMPREF0492_0600 [Lactobacillus acidophilus ATCC 4796]